MKMVIVICFLIFLVVLIRLNISIWFKIGSVLLIICLLLLGKLSDRDDGYTGRLEPIQREIDRIKDYKKAVKLILYNIERVQKEYDDNENDTGLYINYPPPLTDSIVSVQGDSLKLRFIAYPMSIEIEKNDTTIVFRAGGSDYKMVSNKANKLLEIPPYSLYRHSIIYSTKPLQLNEAVTKIENKYYYKIDESDEY